MKGDALVKADVRKGWEIAGQTVPGSSPELDGQVNVLLFTVGESQRLFLSDAPRNCGVELYIFRRLSHLPPKWWSPS